MMKFIFIVSICFITITCYGQPANDNCANATVLTVNGSLVCNQSLDNATVQAGECQLGYAGGSSESVWYRFTATSSSMVIDYLQTVAGTFVSTVRIYGPYAPGGGCVPACASAIYNQIQNGDPGNYISLSGLSTSGNNQYLIQIEDGDPNGPSVSGRRFCIGAYTPASNTSANTPSVINQCGVAFNGTTSGGYAPSGTGTGFRNLDNNLATTCPTCGAQPGADVSYVINNDSWFQFCSPNGGTWSLNFNVGSCVFSGANSGLQMAVFTGTSSALTWHSQAPSPTYAGGTWNSPTITLAPGGCAYMVVDGFAGDACSYSYTLTNLTGGCILPLPIELVFFGIEKSDLNETHLIWETSSEKNNDFFTIERSIDGENFFPIGQVKGAGNSNSILNYQFIDKSPLKELGYYRLKQTDFDGTETISMIVSNNYHNNENYALNIYPNPSSEDKSTFLEFSSKKSDFIQFEILDVRGMVIFADALEVHGKAKVELTNNLNKGVYFVKSANSSGEEFTKKLIVN